MRFILSMLMISALAIFMACQTANSTSTTKTEKPVEKKPVEKAEKKKDDDAGHDHNNKAPRISLADAKKDYDKKEAVFVDTRSETAFKNEHIKGALNVPAADFESKYQSLPKDKKIITYCS